MRGFLTAVICFAFSAVCTAQVVHFQQLNPNFNLKEIQKIQNVNTRKLSSIKTVKLISPQKRNEIFKIANITIVSSWDAFKKDEFILRAQMFDVKKLKKFYSQMSLSSLSLVKKLIEEKKNEK